IGAQAKIHARSEATADEVRPRLSSGAAATTKGPSVQIRSRPDQRQTWTPEAPRSPARNPDSAGVAPDRRRGPRSRDGPGRRSRYPTEAAQRPRKRAGAPHETGKPSWPLQRPRSRARAVPGPGARPATGRGGGGAPGYGVATPTIGTTARDGQ